MVNYFFLREEKKRRKRTFRPGELFHFQIKPDNFNETGNRTFEYTKKYRHILKEIRILMFISKRRIKKAKLDDIPDDWQIIELREIVKNHKSGIFKHKEFYGSGYNIVGVGNLYDNDCIKGQIFKLVKLTEEEKKEFSLNQGDIIYGESSLVRDGIGKALVVKKDGEGTVFAWHTRRLSLNQTKTNSFYISIFLNSQRARNSIISRSTQTALTGITVKEYLDTLIPLPPIKEQQNISEIFSTLDDAIEKTDAIIKETQQLKKGLMEKFFKNKAYCSMKLAKLEKTDLIPIYIKDLGKIITGTTPSTMVDEYYNSNDYMFIGPADLGLKKYIEKSEKYISEKGFRVSRPLPKNTVMAVCIGATIGKVGITSKPCATNQQVNSIVPKKEFPADYVYYLMSGIKKYLLAFSGDTATPILNKGDFGKVISFVHRSFEERETISNILSETDEKIENEKAFKTELEILKKGLSQVLLTGKVRVKV